MSSFCTEDRHALSGSNANRFFKLALVRVALSSTIRVHDLRHFGAPLMLVSGAHPKVDSERRDHSTVGATLDLYRHAVEGLGAETAERKAKAMAASRT